MMRGSSNRRLEGNFDNIALFLALEGEANKNIHTTTRNLW
jgi:hypothetical protein